MAVMILSWVVVAFLFALLAHTVVPDDGTVDIDVTLVLGMTGALIGAALANYLFGESPWALHIAGLTGSILGALGGVLAGALGQRRTAT